MLKLLAVSLVAAAALAVASVMLTPGAPGAQAQMPTPTPPVVSTVVALALDCDLVTPGVQDNCNVVLGAPSVDVGVVLLNLTGAPLTLGAFEVTVRDSDTSRMSPPVVSSGTNLDRNPDFNDAALPGAWGCNPPLADTGMAGPGQADSWLSCHTLSFATIPASPPGLMLGVVHYTVPGGATAGSVALAFSEGVAANGDGVEYGRCPLPDGWLLSCAPATVHLVPPPPGSTATLTPTITPTPTGTFAPTATPTSPGLSLPPSATPTAAFYMAVDCDPSLPGIQVTCSYPLATGAIDVDVYAVSNSPLQERVAAFDFELHAPDLSRLFPAPGLDLNFNGNPDFNQALAGGGWTCAVPPPNPNTGVDGPGKAVSLLGCLDPGPPFPSGAPLPAGGQLKLGTVHYQVPLGALPGSVPLVLSFVEVADEGANTLFVCNAQSRPPVFPVVVGPCVHGVINLFEPPTATPTNTPTSTPTATPTPEFYVTVDCDPALAGIQTDCSYPLDVGAIDVDLYVVSNSLLAVPVAAFDFEVHAPDLARLSPLPGADINFNGNPDFNDALAGSWDCMGPNPNPNTGIDGPGKAVSYLGCMSVVSPPLVMTAPLSAGGQLKLATVHYQVPPGASPGSVPLVLSQVMVSAIDNTNSVYEILDCRSEVLPPAFPVVVGPCVDGVINLFQPPTATPTNTPTNTPTVTPTPAVGMAKVPEGSVASGNVDLSVPKANLFLCTTGPCAGPGEGDLVVVERVSNITTGDSNGDMAQDGLGAYEFNVEYDNFVIQSVNPSDIVFSAGGAGASRGPASCSFSLVLEHIVRFGCVTTGPTPNGPLGDFDLAKLDLIPHPDLANDLFPGNDNGVPTVIKDNGCELADVFGHPVLGSVSGGLLPTCGDLAVTVRILEGDLNLDCKVDVTDEQLIGVHYASAFGSAYYSTWFDLEPRQHDLDIDIKDLQKVFGRDGSTCQQPIPEQTPVDPPVPFG